MIDQCKCHWCEHDLAAWRCSPHVSAWSLSADQWSVVTSGPGPMCQLAPACAHHQRHPGHYEPQAGSPHPGPHHWHGDTPGSRVIWPHMYTGGSHWEGCSSQTGPDTLARAAPPSLGNWITSQDTRRWCINEHKKPASRDKVRVKGLHSSKWKLLCLSCIVGFKCHLLVHLLCLVYLARENFMNELLCYCREARPPIFHLKSLRPFRMSSSQKSSVIFMN